MNSSTGQITAQTSSRRFKENIEYITNTDSSFIYDLKVAKFNYINQSEVKTYGCIAEDIDEQGATDFVCYDSDHLPCAVYYDSIQMCHLYEFIKFKKDADLVISDLQTEKTNLKNRVETLETQVASLTT